jgi:hypothetical protein
VSRILRGLRCQGFCRAGRNEGSDWHAVRSVEFEYAEALRAGGAEESGSSGAKGREVERSSGSSEFGFREVSGLEVLDGSEFLVPTVQRSLECRRLSWVSGADAPWSRGTGGSMECWVPRLRGRGVGRSSGLLVSRLQGRGARGSLGLLGAEASEPRCRSFSGGSGCRGFGIEVPKALRSLGWRDFGVEVLGVSMELLVLRLLGRGVEDPCGDSGVSGFVRVMVWTGSTGARDAADFCEFTVSRAPSERRSRGSQSRFREGSRARAGQRSRRRDG